MFKPQTRVVGKRLDVVYKSNMYAVCIWPGGLFARVGRSCLMQRYACEAAKAGFDVKARGIARQWLPRSTTEAAHPCNTQRPQRLGLFYE